MVQLILEVSERLNICYDIQFISLWVSKTLIFIVFEMSNFVLTKQHLQEVLIFCFNWKKNAAEAHRMLVEVYGDTPTNKS